jgi:2'-5' RNA ligase
VTEGGAPLTALHAGLEAALAERGIPPEGRAFHPHVTLGRARQARGATGLGDLLTGAGEALGETRVEAVHLMRSDLDPAGARYDVLAREALGRPSGHSPSVDMPEGGP